MNTIMDYLHIWPLNADKYSLRHLMNKFDEIANIVLFICLFELLVNVVLR